MADSPAGFLRKRLTYANVMATLALFLALGGTSYAVTALPKNSVGTQQLKKNAVTGDKVKAGSLDSTDFKAGTLLKGDTGATGATGERGPQGPAGPSGSVAGISASWNGNSATVPPSAATSYAAVLGNFSVNAAGSTFVYALAGISGNCTTSASNAPVAALYYKLPAAATWTAVPRSALQLENGNSIIPVYLTGLIDYTNLVVGSTYDLSMRIVCQPGGTFSSSQINGGSFGSLNVGTG